MGKNDCQCSIFGCSKTAHAKGYCRAHYGRLWRTGTPFGGMRDGRPIEEENRDLGNLEFALKEAQKIYPLVVGLSSRIFWKHRIAQLQDTLAQGKQVAK